MIQCCSLSGYVTEIGLGTNPFFWYGIALLLLLELAFVCLPFVHVAFSTSKQRTRQGIGSCSSSARTPAMRTGTGPSPLG
jgi:hypothetical protein